MSYANKYASASKTGRTPRRTTVTVHQCIGCQTRYDAVPTVKRDRWGFLEQCPKCGGTEFRTRRVQD